MTPRTRIENLLQGLPIDRPPFLPAIYDYKATLAGADLHLFGQSEAEMESALGLEVEDLNVEMLTSAYDIYNVEAEAVGGLVIRDPVIGMPDIRNPVIQTLGEVRNLEVPECMSGRMDLFVRAAKSAELLYGRTIPVRGGLSGPFSMASKIFPREELLMETLMNPNGVSTLLRFCTNVIKVYLDGFLKLGLGAAIFDSFIAPPMLSPDLYTELVLPLHQELFEAQKSHGIALRTLIAGGNTLPLLPALSRCGANQLLLDYNIPLKQVDEVLTTYPEILFRVNLSPALFLTSPEEIRNKVMHILSVVGERKNLILGTGILIPGTPKRNIQAARQSLTAFFGL